MICCGDGQSQSALFTSADETTAGSAWVSVPPRGFKTPSACFLSGSAPAGWKSARSHLSPGLMEQRSSTKLNKSQIQIQEEFAPHPCYLPLLKARCGATGVGSGHRLTFA